MIAVRVANVAVVVVLTGCGLLDGTGVFNDPLHGDVVGCIDGLGFPHRRCVCSIEPVDIDVEVFECSSDDEPGQCCLGKRSSTAAASCTCTFDLGDGELGGPEAAPACADDEEIVPSCIDLEVKDFFE